VNVRRGTTADAEAVAELYLRAREAAREYIPMTVHTDDEVRDWISAIVMRRLEVWLATAADGAITGLLVLDSDWVDQLYIEPELTGRGIGSELLEVAKRERPGRLRLWTFESNLGARRFYERHGFIARDRTDGDNEEGAPDVLYEWTGRSNVEIVERVPSSST
jgi:GNAT superfamily N-acetyltransferase